VVLLFTVVLFTRTGMCNDIELQKKKKYELMTPGPPDARTLKSRVV